MRKIFSVLVLVLASIVGYAQQAETLTAVAGSCNVLSVSAPGVGEPGDFYVTALFNDISGQWIDSSVVAGYILWDVDGNRFNIDSVDYGGIIDLWVTDLDTAGTVATGIGAIVQENDNYPFWVAGISQGLNQIINAHMVQMIGNDIASGGGGGTDNQTFAEVLLEGNSAGASDIDMNDNSVNNMDSYSINTTSDDWLIFANGPNLQWSQTGAGARLSLRGATGTDLSRLGVGGIALPEWELDVRGVANADTFRVDGAYYFSTDPVVTSAGDTLIQVWTDSTTAFFIDKSEFGGSGSNQTLAQVLDEGNIANQNINLAQNSLMNVDTVRMDGSLGYFDISANGGPTLSARLSTSGDDFYRLKSNSDEVTFPLGKVGIGDFSSNTVGAGLHLYGTSVSTIRISDSCSTDTCAQAYVDFYRGWNTSQLGRFGFDNSLTPDFYITNHLSGGKIHLETDGVTKFSLLPTGQLQLPQYGDTTFTGTAVKYLGVTDDGDVIEVDGGSGGANTFAVSSITADGIDTIDFQTRAEGYFQIDMGSVTRSTLVFDNPLSATAPTYRLHFQNTAAGVDTITFPDNVIFYNGDTLKSRRIAGDNLIECYYDATNYWCSDTLGISVTTPPSGPTSPPQTNLVAHWRSDTLISESGGKVYQWLDIQNNYALTIPSGADSVTYVTGSTPINNEPYLSFDGVNDGLSCTDTAVVNLVDTSRNFTMLIVTMPYDTTVNVNPIVWSYTVDNSNSTIYQSNLAASNQSRFVQAAPTPPWCTNTDISLGNTQLQEWNYHVVLYDYADIDFRIDGSVISSNNVGTACNPTLDNMSIGMANRLSSVFYKTYIAEIILYDTKKSGAELTILESYIANRYGL